MEILELPAQKMYFCRVLENLGPLEVGLGQQMVNSEHPARTDYCYHMHPGVSKSQQAPILNPTFWMLLELVALLIAVFVAFVVFVESLESRSADYCLEGQRQSAEVLLIGEVLWSAAAGLLHPVESQVWTPSRHRGQEALTDASVAHVPLQAPPPPLVAHDWGV